MAFQTSHIFKSEIAEFKIEEKLKGNAILHVLFDGKFNHLSDFDSAISAFWAVSDRKTGFLAWDSIAPELATTMAKEPPPPLFIITAVWDGRGPMHGSRKIFTKPQFTLAAATAVAEKLKPEWKRRRIYQLA